MVFSLREVELSRRIHDQAQAKHFCIREKECKSARGRNTFSSSVDATAIPYTIFNPHPIFLFFIFPPYFFFFHLLQVAYQTSWAHSLKADVLPYRLNSQASNAALSTNTMPAIILSNSKLSSCVLDILPQTLSWSTWDDENFPDFSPTQIKKKGQFFIIRNTY